MSILQDYEKISKDMGFKYEAISDYLKSKVSDKNYKSYEKELKNIDYENPYFNEKIEDLKKRYNIILLDDVLYNKDEYNKFDKWFNNYLKPFKITRLDDVYSVCLFDYNYYYDWLDEEKTKTAKYGDGHCYEDAFSDYLNDYKKYFDDFLEYDSERSMFCVYCQNKKDAESVAYILSKLYKDKRKMLDLIRVTKKNYDYEFDFSI